MTEWWTAQLHLQVEKLDYYCTFLDFGMMMCSSDYAVFTNDSAQKLLRDKFVLIMGDSGKSSALHSNQVQTETLKLCTTRSEPKSTVACTVACRGLWWLGPGQRKTSLDKKINRKKIKLKILIFQRAGGLVTRFKLNSKRSLFYSL